MKYTSREIEHFQLLGRKQNLPMIKKETFKSVSSFGLCAQDNCSNIVFK